MGLQPMSDSKLRACPLELKSNISNLQFLASIPVIGQLVTLCVEIPLKFIATCFSSFRQTEIGAYYANLDSKALAVSLLVPAIGPVISRIAFRTFDHDREQTLLQAISTNNTHVLDMLFKTCTFSHENLRKAFDQLIESDLDSLQKIVIFEKIYAASPSFQSPLIDHLKASFKVLRESSEKDEKFKASLGVTDERASLLDRTAKKMGLKSFSDQKEENKDLQSLLASFASQVGKTVH